MENDEETRKFDPKDMFWTDTQQASERLLNTVVLYDNKPVTIERIEDGRNFDDGVPRAFIRDISSSESKAIRKRLDSPKFNKYRSLPELGFVNTSKTYRAILLSRRVVRSRQHGLSDNNVACFGLVYTDTGRDEYYMSNLPGYNFSGFFYTEDLERMFENDYPALANILGYIQETHFIAYSRKFAVYCDKNGMKWLYRLHERIGFFSNNNTLTLLKKSRGYREEIMEDPAFTLNNIAEI